MLTRWIAVVGIAAIVIVTAALFIFGRQSTQVAASAPAEILYAEAVQTEDFARASAPLDLSLPRDHGPHFDYQTEWWYFTGNLESSDGRPFGYQLTVFRRGLTPGLVETGSLANNQIYFGHFAITDVESNRHYEDEKWSRGSAALAGVALDPFELRLENWTISGFENNTQLVELNARNDEIAISLQLTPEGDVVMHGENGLSPKSLEPGNASYYLSYPRMQTSGTIELEGEVFETTGQTWFDHEWSTSVLDPEAVGWDWFGLQLDDGRELMLFQIREEDGSIGPVSGGTLIEPDGSVITLSRDDVKLDFADTWRSTETGIEYPSAWKILIPSAMLDLNVRARILDQEMNTAFIYWEGSVQVEGTSKGLPVLGLGYMELTGYGQSMQGIF